MSVGSRRQLHDLTLLLSRPPQRALRVQRWSRLRIPRRARAVVVALRGAAALRDVDNVVREVTARRVGSVVSVDARSALSDLLAVRRLRSRVAHRVRRILEIARGLQSV